MVDASRILLIDDNERSRHDLETVLCFLGEQTIAASSSNWHSRTTDVIDKPAEIAVAIIGVCEFLPLEQLLVPYHFGGELTPDDIGDFAAHLLAAIDALPDQVMA